MFALLCAIVVTNCARLVEISTTNDGSEGRFDLTAQVVSQINACNNNIAVRDASGTTPLYFTNDVHVADVVPYGRGRFRGHISREFDSAYFFCDGYEFLSPGEPPKVEELSSGRFLSGEYDNMAALMRGVVRDAFLDENDSRYYYLTLLVNDELIYCAVRVSSGEDMRSFIGAEVVAKGVVTPYVHGNRTQIGRTFQIRKPSDIRVVKPAPSDPFAVPEMSPLRREHPARLALLGRRRAKGRVLAAWDGRRILLATSDGHVSNVELAEGPLPAAGAFIEIAGFPETDLYRVNFTRAIWRKCKVESEKCKVVDEAVAVTPDDIATRTDGVVCIDANFHGRIVRLRGTVAKIPDDGVPSFYLDCVGRLVAVEADATGTALNGIVPGCTVDVTGVCVMETENWRPNAPFPRMKGFFLVLRGPDDLAVIARPPWWTARRVAFAAFALFAAFLAALIWNVALRRRANALFARFRAANEARLSAETRMRERNALATELHDTLAQNLAGTMFQIKAAGMSARRHGDSETGEKIGIAASSVHSCLSQLRDNLWDLRNGLSAGEDLAEAVGRAVRPHLHGAALRLEMELGGAKFGESFAHAVLCVLRELVINAVRHGKATNVVVMGRRDGGGFAFSVSDDGCGFDFASARGVEEGHYGLQGVRERIRQFGGELRIESAAGKGTTARFHVSEDV